MTTTLRCAGCGKPEQVDHVDLDAIFVCADCHAFIEAEREKERPSLVRSRAFPEQSRSWLELVAAAGGWSRVVERKSVAGPDRDA